MNIYFPAIFFSELSIFRVLGFSHNFLRNLIIRYMTRKWCANWAVFEGSLIGFINWVSDGKSCPENPLGAVFRVDDIKVDAV